MQEELNKLREQLARSRQHSRYWYDLLYNLRRSQRMYEQTKDRKMLIVKLGFEQQADIDIVKTEEAKVKAGEGRPPEEAWR